MQLVGLLKELGAGHRGHLAGGEDDEHYGVRRCPQGVQPLQGTQRRGFTDDLVVGGVPAREFPMNRLPVARVVEHRQYRRLHYRASHFASRTPSRRIYAPPSTSDRARSEEHTSELQSRQYLVCRLLLEKKNKLHKQVNQPTINNCEPLAIPYVRIRLRQADFRTTDFFF